MLELQIFAQIHYFSNTILVARPYSIFVRLSKFDCQYVQYVLASCLLLNFEHLMNFRFGNCKSCKSQLTTSCLVY